MTFRSDPPNRSTGWSLAERLALLAGRAVGLLAFPFVALYSDAGRALILDRPKPPPPR
jgi:hypothetical protein